MVAASRAAPVANKIHSTLETLYNVAMMVVRAFATLRLLLILVLLVLAAAPLAAGLACNSSLLGRAKDGGVGDGGAPVSAPAGVWTWVDVPGTACDDGTMTGIAVNPSPDAASRELFIYFMGGGACWDASTCFVLNTSTHGPFGRAQWEASAAHD